MSDREIILESEMEFLREMIGDLRNCANCKYIRTYQQSKCVAVDKTRGNIDPAKVCSHHEWDKIERREKSYD